MEDSSNPSFTSLFFNVRSKFVSVFAKTANDEGVSSKLKMEANFPTHLCH